MRNIITYISVIDSFNIKLYYINNTFCDKLRLIALIFFCFLRIIVARLIIYPETIKPDYGLAWTIAPEILLSISRTKLLCLVLISEKMSVKSIRNSYKLFAG